MKESITQQKNNPCKIARNNSTNNINDDDQIIWAHRLRCSLITSHNVHHYIVAIIIIYRTIFLLIIFIILIEELLARRYMAAYDGHNRPFLRTC